VTSLDLNALIIPLFIPVALTEVRYRPLGADGLLRRNLLVWGLGGVIVPFIGIKPIDVFMVVLYSSPVTNSAFFLQSHDVGLAMNSGTQAAKEAATWSISTATQPS
jgi:high-affinity K+ transport system ATPase subunit B